MADTENGANKWKYCDLKGKVTFVRVDEFIMVYLHDETVNPEGAFLRFSNPLISYEEANNAMKDGGPGIITKDDVEIIGAFDEKWFEDTIKKGFQLRNDKGEPITTFAQLEEPPATTNGVAPRMDVIKPLPGTGSITVTAAPMDVIRPDDEKNEMDVIKPANEEPSESDEEKPE